jgi:hypothetical protein
MPGIRKFGLEEIFYKYEVDGEILFFKHLIIFW